MAKTQIKKMISHLEKSERKVASAITYEIIDLAEKVCKRFHKVVEGFYMANNVCYFAFNFDEYANDIYTKHMPRVGTNSIEDPNDWDFIELFGINDDDNFVELLELYNEYKDRFELYNMGICLWKVADDKYILNRAE